MEIHEIYDKLKFKLNKMVSRRTNFGERSEPAPDRGGKLQSAGGAAQSNVSPLGAMLSHVQSPLLSLFSSDPQNFLVNVPTKLGI